MLETFPNTSSSAFLPSSRRAAERDQGGECVDLTAFGGQLEREGLDGNDVARGVQARSRGTDKADGPGRGERGGT